MSETAQLLGLPREVAFGGRSYPLAPCTFEIEGLFELWLERQARDAIERHRPHMIPAEYACQLDGWRRDCAAHAFAFGGPLAVQALCSAPGLKYMAYLRLRKLTQDVTEELVERMSRDKAVWRAVQEALWEDGAIPLGGAGPAEAPRQD